MSNPKRFKLSPYQPNVVPTLNNNPRKKIVSNHFFCSSKNVQFGGFCVYNKRMLLWKNCDASACSLCKCYQHTLFILMGNKLWALGDLTHLIFRRVLISEPLTQPVLFVWYE